MADFENERIRLVREKVDTWAKELIEINHRNSLVNFKKPKTSSLDLTGCSPSALSQLLSGNKIGLRALFGDEEEHRDACARARNVRRKIISFREEQGIEVGRVACGLVRATRIRSGARPPVPLRSPLLLRDVTITARTATESDFTLEAGIEAELNPVLLHALQREYGIVFAPGDLDELIERVNKRLTEIDTADQQVDFAFDALAEIAKEQHLDLELERAVVIGLFNYQKMPMVRDLENAHELIASHDLIAAIAGDRDATEQLTATTESFSPPSVDRIAPEDEFLVLDADSSQQQAIEAVLDGHHLVIEGPPGTGKSQTIANIIAGAAAHRLRVLFVAEKRAAIEAVTERLKSVQLDGLVLDLHQSSLSKKHVATQLHESLQRLTREGPVDVRELHDQLVERRARLSDYVRELHVCRTPWDINAYAVRERLLKLGENYRMRCTIRDDRLHALDAQTARKVADDLREFVELGGLRVLRRESPWSRAEVTDEADQRKVFAELDELATRTLHQGQRQMRELVAKIGLPPPATIADCQKILDLLHQVDSAVRTFGPTIFGPDLDAMYLATAKRSVRARYQNPPSWWQRRALIKRLRRMCTTMTGKDQLHLALSQAVRTRAEWRILAGPDATPTPASGLADVSSTYQRLLHSLASVTMTARLEDLSEKPVDSVADTLAELRADQETFWKLPKITELRQRFSSLGLDELVEEIAERNPSAETACQMFWHTWLRSLDEEFRLVSPPLRDFNGEQHDRLVSEFQQLDRAHRETTADRVRRKVALAARDARDEHPEQAQLLKREASKKSRLLPIRKLVEQTADVLLSLRPCWAMSPLVVSQTLPATKLFDLVIFDEASQVEPHDAITSIMRGNQLVVAGDEKQLPPSNFFKKEFEGVEDDDSDEFDLGDFESILSSLRPLIPNQRLRWHYRSQDERLIAFSNLEIYDRDLVTFPGAQQENPLRLVQVDGTTSPGQDGLAEEEVHEVVRLVLEHAEREPNVSLGVITLGLKHRDRVDAAIRKALRDRQDLLGFFSEETGPNRRFFVKNIETVQGDERDAIILSIGIAKKANGILSRRGFGILNQEVGARRLNVAITRAKRRMTVVSSFPSSAIEPSEHITGTELLRRFLEMIERSVDPSDVGRLGTRQLNGFELEIKRRIREAGIMVYPQWGVSDYWIDFALAHPDLPGQMVLAVEADGDRYHRTPSARDRDRLRQEHLERLGWRFHRVWASAWFANPEAATQKIVSAWRAAVDEFDRRQEAGAPIRTKTDSELATLASAARTTMPARRARRPRVPPGYPIDAYSNEQLLDVAWWLLSDGLPLDREERIAQMMAELGFKRKGKKILDRLTGALQLAQEAMDEEDE